LNLALFDRPLERQIVGDLLPDQLLPSRGLSEGALPVLDCLRDKLALLANLARQNVDAGSRIFKTVFAQSNRALRGFNRA
jgi:hypothetical protein